MQASNVYDVALQQVSPRGMAAIRARIPASRVAANFRTYLDQVYVSGRDRMLHLDGQNIFVYRDVEEIPDHLDVEFGVGVAAPFAAAGNLVTP